MSSPPSNHGLLESPIGSDDDFLFVKKDSSSRSRSKRQGSLKEGQDSKSKNPPNEKKEDEVRRCFLCGFDLSLLSVNDQQIHINSCLDGIPSGIPTESKQSVGIKPKVVESKKRKKKRKIIKVPGSMKEEEEFLQEALSNSIHTFDEEDDEMNIIQNLTEEEGLKFELEEVEKKILQLKNRKYVIQKRFSILYHFCHLIDDFCLLASYFKIIFMYFLLVSRKSQRILHQFQFIFCGAVVRRLRGMKV